VIALDTSAIIAIAMNETEAETFDRVIGWRQAIVGTPTLVETHLVLTAKMPDFAGSFIQSFLVPPDVRAVDFTADMYRAAADAFNRFGKGRHPAKLNICDCMAYAVAKVHDVPLLYKGTDFDQTDIRPALP
jgi:ribonuclease VapC